MRDENTGPDERRNYYRILNVQPDAPLEIIRNNYRTLLQKLRLHPDLGGLSQLASAINEAYHVLRDPERRAAYDKKLLAEYGMETLSQGKLAKQREKSAHAYVAADENANGNQRNYYRLLNIQPDAPTSIIKTSYLSLKKQPDADIGLLNEAYSILGNAEKRKLYDRLLVNYTHAEAVELLHQSQQDKLIATARAGGTSTVQPLRTRQARSGKQEGLRYRPLITQYCQFCKTPHSQSPCEETAPLCMECQSPLFPPSSSFLEQRRRDIVRLAQRDGECAFYTDWPGERYHGRIADISPLGMQLQTGVMLDENQVIKLDGDDFKAVGIVTYRSREFEGQDFVKHICGIKFLTVNFDKLKGQFFSANA